MRNRFGLDSRGWSAKERNCTRRDFVQRLYKCDEIKSNSPTKFYVKAQPFLAWFEAPKPGKCTASPTVGAPSSVTSTNEVSLAVILRYIIYIFELVFSTRLPPDLNLVFPLLLGLKSSLLRHVPLGSKYEKFIVRCNGWGSLRLL